MELNGIAFPVLIIADDGWLDYFTDAQDLQRWTVAAVSKYSRRSVALYDSQNRLWQVRDIVPSVPITWYRRLLAATFWNARIPVRVDVQLRQDGTPAMVQNLISAAIDADSDIITQENPSEAIKSRLRGATTFTEFREALGATHAISVHNS